MPNVYIKNQMTDWVSELMDLDSAMAILNAQTMAKIKVWSICVEGSEEWVAALKSPLFLEYEPPAAEAITSPVVEPIPPNLATTENHDNLELERELDLQSVDQHHDNQDLFLNITPEPQQIDFINEEPLAEPTSAEKRAHPRYEIRLRVIIKSGKSTYLTFTKDVSLGGLNLSNEVPEVIFNSEAEIYISAPDQKHKIMFTCVPVASHLGRSRLMFTDINEKKQKVLATWIEQYVQPQAKKVG